VTQREIKIYSRKNYKDCWSFGWIRELKISKAIKKELGLLLSLYSSSREFLVSTKNKWQDCKNSRDF